MTGTVEFIQKIRYVEIPDEKGEMNVYAIPETVENVRELVRCKDCKWYDERISMCDNCGLPREQTFFCADGERRTDDA